MEVCIPSYVRLLGCLMLDNGFGFLFVEEVQMYNKMFLLLLPSFPLLAIHMGGCLYDFVV